MEAAAKTVEVLSQRILPEKPHHLSNNPEWRYRATSGDAKRFEEWHHPRLQYLTLVSEADRGVLMTRSYYDMREDPVKPPPREVNALAKGGEKKKLSLSDYKNKKTGATSMSLPEPAIAKKKESERAASNAANVANAANAAPPSAETRKPDRPKLREPEPPVDGKQRQPREPAVDMRLPPKPPVKHALPPRPPTPNSRKRVADVDEEPRPQKRSKLDASRSGAGAGVGDDRDDAQRRKDRAPPATASRDAPSSALPNGRSILKTAVGSVRNLSPASRSRGDSANGVRPTATGANRPAHTRPEVSSKSSVPPLLSPLHLSFDSRDAEHTSPPKPEKKKREDVRDSGARSPKHRKVESVSGSKRQRSPARVPPLLSPTLPAVVEAALQLNKKTSLESLDGKIRDKDKDKDRDRDDRESPSKRKKPPTMDYSDDEEPAPKTQRKTLVVTLKVTKKLRQSFKRIQALAASTAARREMQAQSHERAAAEEASHPPPARKRPVAATDTASETTALKRPRTSDMPTSSRPPSTPSKKGTTAMSRVSSSNSLAQTPGDTVNATPSAANTADRRTNGQDTLKPEKPENPEKPEAKAMRDKEMRFSILGRRLKHDADVMMQGGRRSPSANSKSREPNPKLGYVLCLESLLAFMAGFQAQNIYRGLCNKRSDPTGWASLFPFIEFLQKEIRRHEVQSRRYLPLYALLLLLHATAIDELIRCYTALENPSIGLADLLRFERTRTRTWPQIGEANAVIDNPGLRVDITPWASLDEITLSSIRILRRWCADEDVDWVPDASLREPVAPKSTPGQNTTRT